MTNQISTQAITFYGSELITLKVENVIYTAVRPIVEALGLSWSTQKRKLDNSISKFNCVHMNTVAEDGKIREMLCMPIRKLNGWLFSINPEKVRSDLKEKVICYQEECFEALYNYWHFGKAERSKERSQTTVDDRTGLRDAVNMLVSKKGLIYSDAYQLIHQRFNVNHIDELSKEQLPQAVEYVHKLVLEGELIEPPKKQIVEIPHEGRWLVIVNKHNPQNYRIKNMDGCNFVDHKKARQLLQETHQTADLLLELSRRMRLIDGYYEENFNTPIAETRNRTLI
ncbi:phage antirepressor N-terminal domain-containing protein [Avibacterium sp. 21-599]|uniref:phage antirepressor N-terminal domain-containing protein n=1 Tax=Avibacterium sp. 21-599 TaxID=2911528 RepID=UPI0022470011|nr:phage antirepressor N-terminal domain-containing protein [Avibacterium sp. 21-599]MCW9717336.1 phage antirepressor N-terminal domain-containing protein [Avibacterium sp. 21-599]